MNNPNNPTDNKDADQIASDVEDASVVDSDQEGSSEISTDEATSAADAELDAIVEDLPDDDQHEHDDHDAEDNHGQGSSFAATALKLLLLVLVVFALALWLVPLAAPHLPTSIAKHIMPGQAVLDERLAALEARIDQSGQAATGSVQAMQQEITDLKARLEAAEAATKAAGEKAAAAREAATASAAATTGEFDSETAAEAVNAAKEAAEISETATAAATEAGKVASAAQRDTASLARQMTSFEARLANLKSEIQAIGDNLASAASQETGASTAEVAAAFAALKARVDALSEAEPDLSAYIRRDDADGFATQDDLRSARTALAAEMQTAIEALPEGGVLATSDDIAELRGSVEGKVSALTDQIAQIGEKANAAAAAATQAESSATQAVGTVAGAIKGASLKSATAALESRMANGLPFAGALDEVVTLTGSPAPEALAMASATGVLTNDALMRRFKPLAPKAVAADLKAQSGDDALGQAAARLQSVFAGRPKNEQAGDDTGAILSRVEARLAESDVAAALGEAEALSDAAKSGLGKWLDDLRFRVDADAAAAAFLAEIGASQG